MAITAGTLLKERYRVERVLGQGGMATVYLARDTHLDDTPVVVKVPKRFLLEDETGGSTGENRERFTREIKQLIKVRGHDGIVRILDQGAVDDLPYYVLEHQGGKSLADRLKAGPQDPQAVLAWLEPVATALDDIAHLGLVHRDVKPDNILFAEGPTEGSLEPRRARLSDFGIVKALGDQLVGRTGNTFIGTLEYMAPEQADPRATLTGACDQYALAATVYEALAGQIPHHGTPRLELPGVRRAQVPARLGTRDIATHVPAGAAHAVARGLSIDVADRFPTCSAFAEAYALGLVPAKEAPPTRRITPPVAPPPLPARPGLGRWLLIGAPVAAAAVVGALALTGRLGSGGATGGDAASLSAKSAVRRALRIESPVPGAFLKDEAIVLRGTLDGDLPAGASVTVDGTSVPTKGRTFSTLWRLAETDGPVEALIACTGGDVECEAVSVRVVVDRKAPRWAEEASAWEPRETAEDTLAFSARLEDAQAVSVRAGESVWATTAAGPGSWQLKAILPVPRQGEASVEFTAEDALGNRAEPRVLVVRRKVGAEPWSADLAAATIALAESRWTDFAQRLAEARSKGLPAAQVNARMQEAERLLAAATRLPLRAVTQEGFAPAKDDPLDLVAAGGMGSVSLRWRGDLEGRPHTLLVLDGEGDGRVAGAKDGWWLGVAETPRGHHGQGRVSNHVISRPHDPFFERGAWRLLEVDGNQTALVVRDPNAGTLEEHLARRWARNNEEHWFPSFAKDTDESRRARGLVAPADPARVPAPAWIFATDTQAALARARAQRKPVFIVVDGEWCTPCRRLDFYTYSDDEVRKALAPFLCFRMDHDFMTDDARQRVGNHDAVPTLGFFDWNGIPLSLPERDEKDQPIDAGVRTSFGVPPARLAARAKAAWEAWQRIDKEGWPVPDWAKDLSVEQESEARRLRVPVAFENAIGMRFVLIPAGTFDMGSPSDEPDRSPNETLHKVTLSRPYYLQTTEVTNEQFERWSADHVTTQHLRGTGGPNLRDAGLGGPRQPVLAVSSVQAAEFAAWVTRQGAAFDFRLPTEAEWEHACRARTGGPWWWGRDLAALARFANVSDRSHLKADWGTPEEQERHIAQFGFNVTDGFDRSAPVGSFRPNPWGLHDMLGNGWEWCEDWVDIHPSEAQTDPVVRAPPRYAPFVFKLMSLIMVSMPQPKDPLKVIKGGNWGSQRWSIRAAARAGWLADEGLEVVGFRLVADVP
jgi:formylglycine-generating enzyme required for sulfatase activity